MKKEHQLKIAPAYFNDIAVGLKTFEIRKNDRDFKVGDTVKLNEWFDEKYTDQCIQADINYVTHYEQKDGYVVFGLTNLKINVADWSDTLVKIEKVPKEPNPVKPINPFADKSSWKRNKGK